MKIIHILKRLDEIDKDIRELKKMEKSLEQNKSFSEPIYLSIEQQINILIGQKVKCLELEIDNPPENLVDDIYGKEKVVLKPLLKNNSNNNNAKKNKTKSKKTEKKTSSKKEDNFFETDFVSVKSKRIKKNKSKENFDKFDPDSMALKMLTQNDIDKKFEKLKAISKEKVETKVENNKDLDNDNHDESVKLLDIALQKGTLDKKDIQEEKKKVRFFRDNFPGAEY